jgi:hypothetical protein
MTTDEWKKGKHFQGGVVAQSRSTNKFTALASWQKKNGHASSEVTLFFFGRVCPSQAEQ